MEMMRRWRATGAACAAAAALCVMCCACAQDDVHRADGGRASEIGHSTRDWLELQREGKQAAPPLTMLGQEASLAYGRYMESFRTKIPVAFGSSLGESGVAPRADSVNTGDLPRN